MTDIKIAVEVQCLLVEFALFVCRFRLEKTGLRWCGRQCFIKCFLKLLINKVDSPRGTRESIIILRMALQSSHFSKQELITCGKKSITSLDHMEENFLHEDASIPFPWGKVYIPDFKIAMGYQIIVPIFRFVVSFEERYQFLLWEFFRQKIF